MLWLCSFYTGPSSRYSWSSVRCVSDKTVINYFLIHCVSYYTCSEQPKFARGNYKDSLKIEEVYKKVSRVIFPFRILFHLAFYMHVCRKRETIVCVPLEILPKMKQGYRGCTKWMKHLMSTFLSSLNLIQVSWQI